MSNGIKYFVTFALGAAAGSVAAWSFLKARYAQLAEEEIEEVREYYRKKEENVESNVNEEQPAPSEEDSDEIIYRRLVNARYTEQEGGSEMEAAPHVHVITPEEFAADDEYQTESLTLYACGTLTDDFDNPIEDIPAMVGDALDHFGEYEDDSVFVRNDRYKCNYEILKDVRTFEEAKNKTLNLVDDE
jgi:hypothetical protein